MRDKAKFTAAPAVVCDFPRMPKRGDPTVRDVADAYTAAYSGGDKSRHHYLAQSSPRKPWMLGPIDVASSSNTRGPASPPTMN